MQTKYSFFFFKTPLQRERPTFSRQLTVFPWYKSCVYKRNASIWSLIFFEGQTYLFCVFPCSCLLSLYRFIVLVTTMGHLGVLQIRLVVRGQGSRCNVMPGSDSWETASVDLYIHRLHAYNRSVQITSEHTRLAYCYFLSLCDNFIGVADHSRAFVDLMLAEINYLSNKLIIALK